ncbi:MAG: hypothetical protein HC802_11365 [Caldilineaceae bacterium]|nr:hypothetical protein [Caldilineaceae bacterium]
MANAKYQASDRGRRLHAARQRMYRRKRNENAAVEKKVTDQTTRFSHTHATVPVKEEISVPKEEISREGPEPVAKATEEKETQDETASAKPDEQTLAPETPAAVWPKELRCARCLEPGVLVTAAEPVGYRGASKRAAGRPQARSKERSKKDCEAMSPMAATEHKEVELAELDQRFSTLRLHCPREYSRLRAAVLQSGRCDPVLVSTQVAPDHLVLIDGFKRVKLIAELGGTTVRTQRFGLEEKAAKAHILLCNQAHRGLTEIEQGWVIHSLCRQQKLPQLEVAQLLKHHQSWVSRRLALVEHLALELQEEIRLGLLSPTVARDLARMPRGIQPMMAQAIRAFGLSSRQTTRLVTLVLEVDDPQARSEVLQDPLRFLERLGQGRVDVARDPRLGAGSNELRRHLLLGGQAMLRLLQSIRRVAPVGLAAKEAEVLEPLWEEALRVCQKTEATLLQLGTDSGLGSKTKKE